MVALIIHKNSIDNKNILVNLQAIKDSNLSFFYTKNTRHEGYFRDKNHLYLYNSSTNIIQQDITKNKGEFSYGQFNFITKTFFGARDRIGIKPFYYSNTKDSFVYSTSIKLITDIISQVSINKQYIERVLTGTAPLPDETFYNEIKRLPPAHQLTYADGKLEINKYWEATPIKNPNQEIFKDRLISAVKLRNSNQTGSELSGGIDSSSISGILASQQKKTFSFRHVMNDTWKVKFFPFKDERQFSDYQLNFSKNIDIVNVDSNGKGIIDELIHEMKIIGSPFYATMSLFSSSLYEAAKDKGIDVLFSGFGGDELVSSKGTYYLQKLIENKEWAKLRSLTNTKLLSLRNIKYYVHSYFPNFKLKKHWREEQLDNHLLKKGINKKEILENDSATQTYNSINEFMLAKISGDTFLTRIEENGISLRARGIEYTYPLLDTDLIECYLGMPDELKYNKETPRSIYKNAIKEFTPKEIYTRNDKTGATVPTVFYRFINDYERIKELLNTYKNGKASEFLNIDKMLSQLELIRKKAIGEQVNQRLDNRIFLMGLQMILYFDMDVLGN